MLNLSEDEQTAEMQREDGLRFALSWDQLSKADQALLVETAKATVAAAKSVLNIPSIYPRSVLKDVPMVTQKEITAYRQRP